MDVKKVIDEALAVLKDGGVILYPTDTVWGIGCDATNEKAVARVYEIKRRSEAKSLVMLACDLDMVARYIREIPSMAIDLVEVNDAPMTLIYPGAQGLAPNAVAADGTVGIRIPCCEPGQTASEGGGAFCRELTRRLRRPLVSTSANVSGEPTPKCFKDIPQEIRESVDYVVSPSLERGATGRSSQIIKIGLRGEVEIIRP